MLGQHRACPCTPAPCLLPAHLAALDPFLSAGKQMDGKGLSEQGCAFQVSNKSSFSCPCRILLPLKAGVLWHSLQPEEMSPGSL